jgi:hypothetical protein
VWSRNLEIAASPTPTVAGDPPGSVEAHQQSLQKAQFNATKFATLQSRLELTAEKSLQCDAMTEQVAACKSDRGFAERECAKAVGENAVLKRLLSEMQHASGAVPSPLFCRATFELDGVGSEWSAVGIVGSIDVLGCWKVDKRQPLLPTKQNAGAAFTGMWKCQVVVPTDHEFDYKFVVESSEGGLLIWEKGDNRTLDLADAGSLALVRGTWRG